MNNPRWWIVAIIVGLTGVVTFSMLAADAGPVNTDRNSVAIKGYDTVAYFTMGRPVQGKAEFEHIWQGARWHFTSAEHRDLFARNPDRYAPRYGGYCAGGMALGRKARVDPDAWAIVDDQLYLNYSKKDRDALVENPAAKIVDADRNWAGMDH
jgi:YHS domain-containing protein